MMFELLRTHLQRGRHGDEPRQGRVRPRHRIMEHLAGVHAGDHQHGGLAWESKEGMKKNAVREVM